MVQGSPGNRSYQIETIPLTRGIFDFEVRCWPVRVQHRLSFLMVHEDLEKLYLNHFLVVDSILSFHQQIQIDYVLPNSTFLSFDHSTLEHDGLDQILHEST